VKAWALLAYATAGPMIVAFYAWTHVGLWACAVVRACGGRIMAEHDHNYRPRR